MDYNEDPDYLDLDDILAQAQPLNCKFLMNIPGLEFLSVGNSNEAIQGTECSLPFWMAKFLYTNSMIDIILPKSYKVNFLDVIEAGAVEVDLHKAGPYYYRFGQLLMGLKREIGNNLADTEEGQRNKFRREEGETLADRRVLADSLVKTFHNRRHRLLEYSTNHRACDQHRNVRLFESRLDNMEKRLFQLGRLQMEEIKKWNSRKIELVTNSLVTARLTKRRKLEASTKAK